MRASVYHHEFAKIVEMLSQSDHGNEVEDIVHPESNHAMTEKRKIWRESM